MKNKKFIQRLRHKYLITISNDKTFENYFNMKLSLMNIISLLFSFSMLIIILVSLAIAFTPLKQLIPGYDRDLRQKIVNNAIYIDSLAIELDKRDKFVQSIQAVISGKDVNHIETEAAADTTSTTEFTADFKRSDAENEFRTEMEEQELFNLHLDIEEKTNSIHQKFFPPVEGFISQSFNPNINHYGVDLVAKPNSRISTVLNGTVIFTDWTVRTGYVISIQHADNTISTYKHNAVLLKKTNDHVKSGEAIAILGNTGELTSGAHLHFELWKDGKAVDPELFIAFK